jgi:hypothetical protein
VTIKYQLIRSRSELTTSVVIGADCIGSCKSHNHAITATTALLCSRSDLFPNTGGCRGRDRMIVGFTTTYAISSYHHWCCEFWSRSGWGVQHYVIVCQWLATGRGFSPIFFYIWFYVKIYVVLCIFVYYVSLWTSVHMSTWCLHVSNQLIFYCRDERCSGNCML